MHFHSCRKAALATVVISIAALGSLINVSNVYAEKGLKVYLDRAKIVTTGSPIEMAVLGNPSIVDATLVDQNTIVLTGRSYGETNLVVLGADREVLIDRMVHVTAAHSNVVSVFRKSGRTSYNCVPTCQQILRPGDEHNDFATILKQSEKRDDFSKGLRENPASNSNSSGGGVNDAHGGLLY